MGDTWRDIVKEVMKYLTPDTRPDAEDNIYVLEEENN